jgi:hypothetical protein
VSAAPVTQGTRCLSEALRLAEHGYALTPVTLTRLPSGKKGATFHARVTVGGRVVGWRHEAAWSRDPDQIRAWWTDHPDTSFAIGGAVNRIEGVDLDMKAGADQPVDGVSWWAGQSLPFAPLVQHTPSGGVHLIWRVGEQGGLPQRVDGLTGVDTRNRSGLFYAAGSYIVGEQGHYEVAGELPPLAELGETPAEVVRLFERLGRRAERAADGRITYHDTEWQKAQVRRAWEAVRDFDREHDTEYRKRLQHLGLMYGRIVEQGAVTAEAAEAQWLTAHRHVWGPQVWPENIKDFRDALRDGPALERWRTPEQRPSGDEDADTGGETPDAPDAFELEILREIRTQDVRELARKRRAERDRAKRPSIESELIDVSHLAEVEPPAMLMGELIPARAVGFLAGRTGTYKSFLAVSWACSLATGRAWQGRSDFEVSQPVKVLYVAAEGASGVAQRILAWQQAHRRVPEGMLVVYPKPIRLASEPDVEELSSIIERYRFGVVIIDTLHRSAPGVDEQSNTEFGLIYEAVAGLRDAHGTTTILVDHTGHQGGTRPRGASAKLDDADFVLGIDREGDIPTPSVQRTLRVVKRKDMPTAGEWLIRLRDVAPSAVLELGAVDAADPFGERDVDWWNSVMDRPLPEAVGAIVGDGSKAGREAYRVLDFVGDPAGLTVASVQRAVNARPGVAPVSESTVRRGMRLLRDAGILQNDGKAKWWIDPDFDPVSRP